MKHANKIFVCVHRVEVSANEKAINLGKGFKALHVLENIHVC